MKTLLMALIGFGISPVGAQTTDAEAQLKQLVKAQSQLEDFPGFHRTTEAHLYQCHPASNPENPLPLSLTLVWTERLDEQVADNGLSPEQQQQRISAIERFARNIQPSIESQVKAQFEERLKSIETMSDEDFRSLYQDMEESRRSMTSKAISERLNQGHNRDVQISRQMELHSTLTGQYLHSNGRITTFTVSGGEPIRPGSLQHERLRKKWKEVSAPMARLRKAVPFRGVVPPGGNLYHLFIEGDSPFSFTTNTYSSTSPNNAFATDSLNSFLHLPPLPQSLPDIIPVTLYFGIPGWDSDFMTFIEMVRSRYIPTPESVPLVCERSHSQAFAGEVAVRTWIGDTPTMDLFSDKDEPLDKDILPQIVEVQANWQQTDLGEKAILTREHKVLWLAGVGAASGLAVVRKVLPRLVAKMGMVGAALATSITAIGDENIAPVACTHPDLLVNLASLSPKEMALCLQTSPELYQEFQAFRSLLMQRPSPSP